MIKSSLKQLAIYLELVPLKFLQIPMELLLQRPASGKWSKQEILGHLIDSALHNWQRMAIAKDSKGPYVAHPYRQAELVRNNAYQNLPAKQIIELWQKMNQQILVVCRGLNESDLQKEVHLPYANDMVTNLAFLINDYVDHMEHHLKQIFGSLEDLLHAEGWGFSVSAAKEFLENQEAKRFVTLKERGTLSVEYYAPRGHDPQQPHCQDELYVVTSGIGQFYCDGKRGSFKSGDVLFVPAGVEHRFENFSEDFGTWVIFYGPDGGELPMDKVYLAEREIEGKKFQVSTSKSRLDLEVIYSFLKETYWANKRSKVQIEKSLNHCLTFGLYHEGQQIGLARVVTDYSVFGYLADVFVLEEYRRIGLGEWLTKTVIEHPDLQEIKWFLVTRDAHSLYEKFGFARTKIPNRIMEWKQDLSDH